MEREQAKVRAIHFFPLFSTDPCGLSLPVGMKLKDMPTPWERFEIPQGHPSLGPFTFVILQILKVKHKSYLFLRNKISFIFIAI